MYWTKWKLYGLSNQEKIKSAVCQGQIDNKDKAVRKSVQTNDEAKKMEVIKKSQMSKIFGKQIMKDVDLRKDVKMAKETHSNKDQALF